MTMRRTGLFLVLVLAFSTPGFAGKILGGITEGGKPIAKGIKIDVACGANKYAAETDGYGAFSLFAPDKGKCTLKVNYQGQVPSFDINSYDGTVQYDFIL